LTCVNMRAKVLCGNTDVASRASEGWAGEATENFLHH